MNVNVQTNTQEGTQLSPIQALKQRTTLNVNEYAGLATEALESNDERKLLAISQASALATDVTKVVAKSPTEIMSNTDYNIALTSLAVCSGADSKLSKVKDKVQGNKLFVIANCLKIIGSFPFTDLDKVEYNNPTAWGKAHNISKQNVSEAKFFIDNMFAYLPEFYSNFVVSALNTFIREIPQIEAINKTFLATDRGENAIKQTMEELATIGIFPSSTKKHIMSYKPKTVKTDNIDKTDNTGKTDSPDNTSKTDNVANEHTLMPLDDITNIVIGEYDEPIEENGTITSRPVYVIEIETIHGRSHNPTELNPIVTELKKLLGLS